MSSFQNGQFVIYLQHLIEEDNKKDCVFIVTESDPSITKVTKWSAYHDVPIVESYSIPTVFLMTTYMFDVNKSVAWNLQTRAQPFGKCYCGKVPPPHINEDGTEESSMKFIDYRPSTDQWLIRVRLDWGAWIDLWVHSSNLSGSTV
jgi:hypothetical protein